MFDLAVLSLRTWDLKVSIKIYISYIYLKFLFAVPIWHGIYYAKMYVKRVFYRADLQIKF